MSAQKAPQGFDTGTISELLGVSLQVGQKANKKIKVVARPFPFHLRPVILSEMPN